MGDAVKDWRLDNLETTSLDLRGANLVCKPYRLYAPHWDHDHCCGCWNRLADPEITITIRMSCMRATR